MVSSSSILFLPSEGILILIPRSDLARETNAVVPSSFSPSFLPQLTNMPAPLKQSTADLSNLMVGFPTLDIFHQFSSPEEGMGEKGGSYTTYIFRKRGTNRLPFIFGWDPRRRVGMEWIISCRFFPHERNKQDIASRAGTEITEEKTNAFSM